jgi:hypothetical protein
MKRVEAVLLSLLRTNEHITIENAQGAAPLLPGDEPAFHDTNAQIAVCLRFVTVVLAHGCVRWALPVGIMMVRAVASVCLYYLCIL